MMVWFEEKLSVAYLNMTSYYCVQQEFWIFVYLVHYGSFHNHHLPNPNSVFTVGWRTF